ncbi:MAG: HD domain-containing protein [Candidatus Omnitrophica bacterium]|nr:HD domain-containing protein [Candidatus Omnitrophota bacterium]
MPTSTPALPTMLQRLTRQPGYRRVQEAVKPTARRPIWWTLDQPAPRRLDYRDACRTCRFVRESLAQRRICQRRFLGAIERAQATKRPEAFLCPIQRPAVVFPMVQDQQVTGHVAVCHADQPLPAAGVQLAAAALEASLRELERERELANLYESIQPRCVALSTIHTIHRLISSTLDVEELMPRLARLCVQVLRARRCAIWLVTPDRRLVPAAVADLRARRPTETPLRMGQGIPGRVAATAKASLKHRQLVVPLIDQDCIGVIAISEKQDDRPFTAFDQEILVTMAEQAVVAIGNARLYAQQEKVALGTIKSLAAILDAMDGNAPHGKSHTRLLAEVALALADALGLGVEDRRSVHYAALLHDAGRVAVPDEILLKPTKLTGRERRIIQRHPVKGVELMRPLEILEPAIPIILHHHERYDGRGYPKGLRGDEIPLGARILAVANAYEAMVCERPYRDPLAPEQAAREIQRNAGTQFDPRVVEAFQRLVDHGVLPRLTTRVLAPQ